ncbi:hypothetical protein L6R53_03495 [Myxococcota bacterium]|nr:hypothetical protein [Myxococcota bacterium]
MDRDLRTLARDARDLLGAATLSLGLFGAPVALALTAMLRPPVIDLEVQAEVTREAVWWTPPAPAPAPVEPAPAPPPPAAPVEEEVAAAPEEPATTDEAGLAEGAVDGAAEERLLVATAPVGATRPEPRLGRRVDPRVLRGAGTKEGRHSQRVRHCEEATDDIAQLGEGSYQVARSLVDLYVNDLELAQELASVAWHRDEDGKIDGFRIRRIKCGNVLYQAGFRNGDVVHSVNGKKIRTIFGAISAYRKLKHKEQLRIDATTKEGQSKHLRYKIG